MTIDQTPPRHDATRHPRLTARRRRPRRHLADRRARLDRHRVAVGLHAIAPSSLRRPAARPRVTSSPAFRCRGFADLVLGGHDLSTTPLGRARTRSPSRACSPPASSPPPTPGSSRVDAEIRPGYDPATHRGTPGRRGASPGRRHPDFRERHALGRVVVIDISSTEPIPEDHPEFHDAELLAAALADPARALLPASSIAAFAAIESGSAYACFTPSTGARLPALHALAGERGIPYAGQDGKTGETLLEAVLAPMFRRAACTCSRGRASTCSAAATARTSPTPRPCAASSPARPAGCASLVGDHAWPRCTSTTSPTSATSRRPGTTSRSRASSARACTMETPGRATTRCSPRRSCSTSPGCSPAATPAGAAARCPSSAFFFKDPWGSDVHDFAEQTTPAPGRSGTGSLARRDRGPRGAASMTTPPRRCSSSSAPRPR